MHVDAICDHLQAVTEGRIGDLAINIAPGLAKSLTVCVFWPAWVWIDRPATRFIFASYSAGLALRDSVKCRSLIASSWYQERWGDRFHLSGDENQKQRFANSRTGYRIATSVGGTGTGERGDIVVVDDPTSVDQAASDTERKFANEWWSGTMSTRLNDFRTGHRIVIQQRLHEDDLTGYLLDRGGYELLRLPMEFEPDSACSTSIGWTDPRREAGELLWPAKITAADVEDLKRKLGSYRFAGQYQQSPAPAGGGIFKRVWWRYWQRDDSDLGPVSVRREDGSLELVEPVVLPSWFDQQILSWDMAFKDLSTSDFVVGQCWGCHGADRYLLDQVRDRLSFPKTVQAVRAMARRWPRANAKLVEDKANGSAVISSLRHEIQGLIAVNPQGGKVARAQAAAPFVEAGNIYLPHPRMVRWVQGFLDELSSFPNAKNDDQTDAATQAILRTMRRNGGPRSTWVI